MQVFEGDFSILPIASDYSFLHLFGSPWGLYKFNFIPDQTSKDILDFIHAFSSDNWIHLRYGRIETENYSETYRILFRGEVESLLAIDVIDKYVCFKPLTFNINEEYKKTSIFPR
jgi:hypothetical protein